MVTELCAKCILVLVASVASPAALYPPHTLNVSSYSLPRDLSDSKENQTFGFRIHDVVIS